MIDTPHNGALVPAPLPSNLPPPRPRRLPSSLPRRAPRPANRVRLPSFDLPDTDGEFVPLEVWWSLEDLWLRLHQVGRLQVVDADTLVLPCWRHWQADPALRAAVFDVDGYAWGSAWRSDRGSFVRALDYDGDDLVCRLTPASDVQGWPDGASLVLLRAALFVRLATPIRHEGGQA